MTGSLHGRVLDFLGAVLPGVTVRVSTLDKLTYETITDVHGQWNAPVLEAGHYDLTFTLQGMFPAWRAHVTVIARERVNAGDVVMEPSGAVYSAIVPDPGA